MNICKFINFKTSRVCLSFDVLITYDGIDPVSKKEFHYTEEMFPFKVVFSEPLKYNNQDVLDMLNCYIKQAHLDKKFQNIEICLPRTGKNMN